MPGLEDAWRYEDRRTEQDLFREAKSVVAQRGDTCKPGMFVWCTSTPNQGVVRIVAIYARDALSTSDSRAPAAIIQVELFEFGERHPVVDCPCLTRSGSYLVQPSVSK